MDYKKIIIGGLSFFAICLIANFSSVLAEDDFNKYINFANSEKLNAEIDFIVDGDTIDATINGSKQRIRLIGINAPESGKSSDFNKDEPMYAEAKQYLIDNLLYKNITLIVNKNNELRFDSYNRLLAIVINNGKIVNLEMLKNGLAETYYLDNELVISDVWKQIESEAKQNYLSLWKNFNKNEIIINEILPNPIGSDKEYEWIELYNNTDQPIDIGGWYLDDAKYGSKPYLFPDSTIILPNDFLLVPIGQSKIALNNTSDEVNLFDKDLFLIDKINYSKVKEGFSYGRIDNEWFWLKTPTSAQKNISNEIIDYSAPTISATPTSILTESPTASPTAQYPFYSIAEAKDHINDYVKVHGYVTVVPNTFSDRYFYIQDENSAIEIYFLKALFPELNTGDEVEITGKITGSDKPILRIYDKNSITIINNNIKVIEPAEADISQINNLWEGKLVNVSGAIPNVYKKSFYISNQTGKIKIDLSLTKDFSTANLAKGDQVNIIGIINCSKSGCVLRPRSQNDLQILAKKIAAAKIKTTQKKKTVVIKKIAADKNIYTKERVETISEIASNNQLDTILYNYRNKNQITKQLTYVKINYYVIIIASVLCIILFLDLLCKQNILPATPTKLRN